LSALDSKIDDLYRQPLAEFTAARNALAKTLKGDDAKRVRALPKPTIVPWAVNQVYWHARPLFDRVVKSGERLRAAQIASLEGRRADPRAAGDAHRQAVGEAVKEAERLSRERGSQAPADALMRTFEALSLLSDLPEPAGRMTKPLQPAGFEALAGVTPREIPETEKAERSRHARTDLRVVHTRTEPSAPTTRETEAERKREREAREAARRHEAAVKAAEAALARAEAAESQARTTWERAHDELLQARQKLRDVRSSR
jgi:hypothetical protein